MSEKSPSQLRRALLEQVDWSAVQQGLMERQQGLGQPLAEVDAEIREEFGFPPRLRQNRLGFALIELPLVLSILAVLGLAVVFTISHFFGSVAWYTWLIGGFAPPLALIATAAISAWIEVQNERSSDNGITNQELRQGKP